MRLFLISPNRAAFFNTVLKKVLKVTKIRLEKGVKKGVKKRNFCLFHFFFFFFFFFQYFNYN
jgi:hypothetical protein